MALYTNFPLTDAYNSSLHLHPQRLQLGELQLLLQGHSLAQARLTFSCIGLVSCLPKQLASSCWKWKLVLVRPFLPLGLSSHSARSWWILAAFRRAAMTVPLHYCNLNASGCPPTTKRCSCTEPYFPFLQLYKWNASSSCDNPDSRQQPPSALMYDSASTASSIPVLSSCAYSALPSLSEDRYRCASHFLGR